MRQRGQAQQAVVESSGSPTGAVTAIVPLKGLRHAKGRLSPALGADERRALTLRMFAHVLGLCAAVPVVTRVLVVAGDDDAAAAARGHGVEVVGDPGGGLNAAVSAADRQVTAATSVVLAADLPHATADEVANLLALARDLLTGGKASARTGCVLVAPTTDGGTAALVRSPPRVVAPAYGTGSSGRHLAAGASAGALTGLAVLPGLARDVDRPADLPAGTTPQPLTATPLRLRHRTGAQEEQCRRGP